MQCIIYKHFLQYTRSWLAHSLVGENSLCRYRISLLISSDSLSSDWQTADNQLCHEFLPHPHTTHCCRPHIVGLLIVGCCTPHMVAVYPRHRTTTTVVNTPLRGRTMIAGRFPTPIAHYTCYDNPPLKKPSVTLPSRTLPYWLPVG